MRLGVNVKLLIAVTDGKWFELLKRRPNLAEINFWAPSPSTFHALQPGELFLFKLHAPHNAIVGGGVFAYATTMPCSLAWEAFGEANGAESAEEMRARIAHYRHTDPGDRSDFTIGCRILTQPFFFHEADWIPTPASWSRNIVSFKTYGTDNEDGMALWNALSNHLTDQPLREFSEADRYGEPRLIRPRLGQGAFRLLVTDIYDRRCAVTGERTLPALEAAHIRPYKFGGEHEGINGLLLRRDVHSLFDSGYVTVTPDLHFEVSRAIRDEFDNGHDYYALHGSAVRSPTDPVYRPSGEFLAWHNEHCFKG